MYADTLPEDGPVEPATPPAVEESLASPEQAYVVSTGGVQYLYQPGPSPTTQALTTKRLRDHDDRHAPSYNEVEDGYNLSADGRTYENVSAVLDASAANGNGTTNQLSVILGDDLTISSSTDSVNLSGTHTGASDVDGQPGEDFVVRIDYV